MEVAADEILKAPGESALRVEGVAERAYCGVGTGYMSRGSTLSYRPCCRDSNTGSDLARTLEDGGREIPNTDSVKGSLNLPEEPSADRVSSWEDMGSSRVIKACRLPVIPTLGCFLLNTFERGLSMVEADDPETKEGVRVLMLTCTSSFGSRDEELADLYDVNPGR